MTEKKLSTLLIDQCGTDSKYSNIFEYKEIIIH